jgi:putative inorganic carbon (hco3(-)) transporter
VATTTTRPRIARSSRPSTLADRLFEGPGLAVLGALVAAAIAYASVRSPALALAGAGALVFAVLVLVRSKALLLLFVAALPWEGALAYPSNTLSVVKLLGVLLLAAWLIQLAAGTVRLQLPGSLLPVALFAMSIGVSLLLSPSPSDGFVKALRYALYILFLFLVIQLTADRRQIRAILRVFVLSAAAAAAWALYRFLILGNVERAAGPITDPNDFGYLQACVLPLAGYLLAAEPRRRLLWGLCFALMAAAILASLSRGAMVGLGGLLLWAVLTRRVPLGGVLLGAGTALAIAALALVIWSPLINDRLQSHGQIAQQNVTSRVAFWAGAVRMWEDHPITGVGVDRFGIEATSYVHNSPIVLDRPVAHNAYLEILAEQGGLGLIAFLGFLGTTWALLARAHRNATAMDDDDGRWMATAMQGTFVVSTVSATFLSAELQMPFWLVGALAAVIARQLTR